MKPHLPALLLCIFVFQIASATDYYISSSSGNDSRSPLQATNSTTPWKSIAKVNSYFASLQPGDRILFKRGDTFYGSLRIAKSGTATAPITIGAYGSGNKPVLSGFATLSSWTSIGNGIYESVNTSLGAVVNMVTMGDKPQQMGRYPNSNAANKGYLVFESFGTNYIVDNELRSATSWTNAEVVVRTAHWVLDRRKITSHAGTRITYATALTYTLKPKFGYFIQNHIKTLDQPGEWFYNPATKKLAVYNGAAAPLNVKAAAADNIISIIKHNYINISDLSLQGSNLETIKTDGASNINVVGCDLQFSGTNAVRTTYGKYVKYDKCFVTETNNNAFDLRNSVSYATITNNTISNTGTRPGMGLSHNDAYLGIIVNGGSDHTIEYNSVVNTGYIAIRFTGNNISVKNNFIDRFCLAKDDGAGIYTFNGARETFTSRTIAGNIILNGIGANEGTDKPGYLPAEGIYMDDNTTNVDIINNTVANCNKGIFIHNASNIRIRGNTLFNNREQLSYSHDEIADPIRNNVALHNKMVARIPAQLVSSVKSVADDIAQMGRFDSNYYCRPIDDRMVVYTSCKNNSGTRIEANYDLPGWQNRYKKDPKSKNSPITIPQYRLLGVVGPNRFTNGNFDKSTSGVHCAGCTITWSATPGILTGAHAQVTIAADQNKSNIAITAGAVSSTKHYVLRFSARASAQVDLGLFLRQGPSPYAALTPVQYRKLLTGRGEFEILFSNPVSNAQSTLMIVAYNPNVKYYIDNIQLYEANAVPTNPDDYLRFEYNAAKTTKQVTLNGTYYDMAGKTYTSGITLAPFTSVVLIRSGAAATSAIPTETFVDSTLAPDNNDEYTLFPNPVNSILNVECKSSSVSTGTITIVDVFGRPMKSANLNNVSKVQKIDIGSLAPGTYILAIETRTKRITRTFVKL